MEALGDAALIARLRAGDADAFEELVRTYGGRLLAVARRFVRNESDAQDITQAAYLSAFRALPQFEGGCQLSTWLHRIVVNTALMKLRTRRRKPSSSSPTGRRRPTRCSNGRRRERRFAPASPNCPTTTARC